MVVVNNMIIKENIIKELLVGSDIPLPVNYKTKDKKEDKETKDENEQKNKENVKEVKKATSFSSEDFHGGKEATKDIKDSPSNADNGENKKDEATSKGGGKETKDNNNEGGEKENTKENKKGRGTRGKEIENLLNALPKPMSRISNTNEELVQKALKIIKRILKNTVGSEQSEDSGNNYNKRILSSLIVKDRLYLFNQAKKNKVTKEISMFIDTSMSMSKYTESIKQMIRVLSKQGYIVNLYGAGNGLWYEDATNDKYNVRKTLEAFEGVNVPELCRVTIDTAVKICNNSELSIIIADFDGLSDFVKLSQKCAKDKIPYFLSTEDRYDWDEPWIHDWVDEKYCKYPLNRVFELL